MLISSDLTHLRDFLDNVNVNPVVYLLVILADSHFR
jgi:hypothetical protein